MLFVALCGWYRVYRRYNYRITTHKKKWNMQLEIISSNKTVSHSWNRKCYSCWKHQSHSWYNLNSFFCFLKLLTVEALEQMTVLVLRLDDTPDAKSVANAWVLRALIQLTCFNHYRINRPRRMLDDWHHQKNWWSGEASGKPWMWWGLCSTDADNVYKSFAKQLINFASKNLLRHHHHPTLLIKIDRRIHQQLSMKIPN